MTSVLRRFAGLSIVVLIAFALAACGSESASTSSLAESAVATEQALEVVEDATTDAEATTAEALAADVACESVSKAMLKGIASGAQDGTGLKPIRGAAYKSPDFEKVYFIAMEFSADGVDSQVGVWASNSLKPGGGILMSVDGFAKQFTVWPDAENTDAQISPADPGVEAAKSCLG